MLNGYEQYGENLKENYLTVFKLAHRGLGSESVLRGCYDKEIESEPKYQLNLNAL
jgi:hypothetical protein